MKTRSILFIAAIGLFVYSCKDKPTGGEITISPESGTSYKSGEEVAVKVGYPVDAKPDSVVYMLDSVRFAVKTDTAAAGLKTDTLSLGPRVITAKLYRQGVSTDISTNIVLTAPKAPEELTYKVEKVFPHDTAAYTEGLIYQDGYLWESTGNKGASEMRKVDLATGKVIQRAKLGPEYFGEGSAIVGDKIVMMTYREKVGFVFDKNTFKLIKTFPNNVGVEGWGMAYDGQKLYLDDSTNRIWFLDKNDYRQIGFIDVYNDQGPVNAVNELEYIDGKLYANVYTTDDILIINAKTGAVEQRVSLGDIWPMSQRPPGFDNDENVLNGIAWDAKGKRLFVTGKKWPHLYQVKFVPKQ